MCACGCLRTYASLLPTLGVTNPASPRLCHSAFGPLLLLLVLVLRSNCGSSCFVPWLHPALSMPLRPISERMTIREAYMEERAVARRLWKSHEPNMWAFVRRFRGAPMAAHGNWLSGTWNRGDKVDAWLRVVDCNDKRTLMEPLVDEREDRVSIWLPVVISGAQELGFEDFYTWFCPGICENSSRPWMAHASGLWLHDPPTPPPGSPPISSDDQPPPPPSGPPPGGPAGSCNRPPSGAPPGGSGRGPSGALPGCNSASGAPGASGGAMAWLGPDPAAKTNWSAPDSAASLGPHPAAQTNQSAPKAAASLGPSSSEPGSAASSESGSLVESAKVNKLRPQRWSRGSGKKKHVLRRSSQLRPATW